MTATLYEALGISPSASDEEVRTALRKQIRKYYAKTRDGHGNVEEALRFINHASRILGDPALREQYDYELKLSAASLDQRIEHVVSGAVGRPAPEESKASASPAAFSGTPPLHSAKGLHHAGLTEAVTTIRRSTSAAIALSAALGLLIAGAVVFMTPADVIVVTKQVLVWATLALIGITAVYGVVHGVAWTQRRRALAASIMAGQAEMTILNWRRDKSVFLGASQPQEDAGWIFKLRMAELERAKSGRTSEPRPWNRLAARLFDYALWGLVLALPFTELTALGIIPDSIAFWLAHPLVAPVLITATWIPVETLLITLAQTTPGKWLFGVYLQFSISDAYAVRDKRSRRARAWRRELRVWYEGVGFGFPLLAPICIAVAYERVGQEQETSWDSAQDCLVTHGPAGPLNTITGIVGLTAMLWLYGVAWNQTVADSIEQMRTSVPATVSTAFQFASSLGRGTGRLDATEGGGASVGTTAAHDMLSNYSASDSVSSGKSDALTGNASADAAPLDPDLAPLFADRQLRIASLKVDGPRSLKAQNYRRAVELCRAWANLDLASAEAWRCLGEAYEAQGNHREAVSSFRKAKQFDRDDPALDRAINRNQSGILADFLRRHGR